MRGGVCVGVCGYCCYFLRLFAIARILISKWIVAEKFYKNLWQVFQKPIIWFLRLYNLVFKTISSNYENYYRLILWNKWMWKKTLISHLLTHTRPHPTLHFNSLKCDAGTRRVTHLFLNTKIIIRNSKFFALNNQNLKYFLNTLNTFQTHFRTLKTLLTYYLPTTYLPFKTHRTSIRTSKRYILKTYKK